MTSPKLLFHYTSINNLALILKSKSIRFNRLDKVNDKREGVSSDFGYFGQYIFITCWTETSEENLAFWNIYTPKMRGVRIELPMPFFELNKIYDKYDAIIEEKEIVNEEKGIFIAPHFTPIYKLNYTENKDLLTPTILVEKGIDLKTIGYHKKKIWKFENEWRYRLNIFPLDNNPTEEYFPERYMRLVYQKIPPPISDYFIKIKEDSFKQMKVRLSPKAMPGDFEIIDALLRVYNINAKVEISHLTEDIR